MTNTANLALPYIDQNQSQKHVTHNLALRALDALAHLAVIRDDWGAPPGTPADGDRYIVAASPTGAWTGHAGHVAAWQDGAWNFYAPKIGWRCFVALGAAINVWNGTAWVSLISVLQNLSLLGIGATADAANPLSVKLNGALFAAKTAAEGGNGDLAFKLSKESATDVLQLLLQTNFSTRAEIGLLGDDDFRIKVSPDGSTFYEALQVDRATGEINMRQKRLQAALAAHGGKTEIFCDEELITLSGAATNSTVQIPDGAIVLAVSNRVVTAITGATSYDCGDAANTTRFGGSLGVGLGATNRGLIGPMPYYANTSVLYTAQGGNFTGGQVRMTIHYLKPAWATS